ncbi:type II secretion system protein GspJ [Mixta theicola]|uniref:Type II secretion system protein J n=1 Tax=Mixta theicola TaxID=1458355 RepID=A0A2K1QB99_9GAMM|nr:type II secretion system minor pseudopilin GspJ [Mixta theicola]PNS12306.1 type II secretion system protein GspJ [Mixta theicola]GLR08063.1 type II secretion system protein GspJ [Mixta theicola]
MASANRYRRTLQRGFTLLEILIALALTAGLSLMCWQVMHGVLLNSATIKQQSTRFTQLQFAVTLLERDFSQAMVSATQRNQLTESEAAARQALLAETQAHFLRHNWLNPGALLPRTELEEVAYRLKQGRLERLSWRYPQQGEDMPPAITTLLTDTESFHISYYRDGKVTDRWNMFSALPDSVKITLRLTGVGEIHRRIIVKPTGKG